ncbi:hypothetical protein LXL04_028732 [Taraxacum kok-saghyz]
MYLRSPSLSLPGDDSTSGTHRLYDFDASSRYAIIKPPSLNSNRAHRSTVSLNDFVRFFFHLYFHSLPPPISLLRFMALKDHIINWHRITDTTTGFDCSCLLIISFIKERKKRAYWSSCLHAMENLKMCLNSKDSSSATSVIAKLRPSGIEDRMVGEQVD